MHERAQRIEAHVSPGSGTRARQQNGHGTGILSRSQSVEDAFHDMTVASPLGGPFEDGDCPRRAESAHRPRRGRFDGIARIALQPLDHRLVRLQVAAEGGKGLDCCDAHPVIRLIERTQ